MGIGCFDLGLIFGDHNGLVLLFHLQGHVCYQRAVDVDDQPRFGVILKSVRGHVHLVLPYRQNRKGEYAILVCFCGLLDSGRHIGDHHRGPSNCGTRLIRYDAGDFSPDLRLGTSRNKQDCNQQK